MTAGGLDYLSFQALVGITKHNGGFAATNELLSLCHIEQAREVLNIGCGIGVGSAYIAKTYGCRVVGVDIQEKMVEWSRLRAREEGVEDKVEFRVANVLDLPFEADRFDVVFCESVLAFVDDKARAVRQCVRVARPGGYVGLNETYWIEEPSPEMVEQVRASVGSAIPTSAAWQSLWDDSGLQDRVVRLHQIEARSEIRDRMQWIGWRWSLRGFARLFRLYLSNPPARQSLKQMFSGPSLDTMRKVGYGLYVGRKAAA
jgi:SAM-dependent methyltransferase